MTKTIIDASNKRLMPDFKELYDYRQLLFSLAWRDIRVKYAQTYIGILWAFINPLISMVVLVFIFNNVAGMKTGNIPAAVFTISGLVVWNYFSILFSEAGTSIIGAQNMIKKIYFPRIVIPLSKAISGLVDLLVTLVCLFGFMMYYQTPLNENFVYAPIFLLIAVLCGITGGIWMSALSVRFRDFTFVIPLITRLGMFLSPIAYAAEAIPEKYRLFYYLNPLTGAIEGFRWSFFGVGQINPYVYISLTMLTMLFILGVVFFSYVERIMADIL